MKRPSTQTAMTPISSAPISGGTARTMRGKAPSARKPATIGAAIQRSSRKANTMSRPKRRNTPATMPITIGIGTASIARRTQPEKPSASIRMPVTTNAPITSGHSRWVSAGPTSTAPGIVHRKTSGCLKYQEKAMLMRPLTKNAPKIHDDRSDGVRPPRVPTARMIATGPEAANAKATSPLAR